MRSLQRHRHVLAPTGLDLDEAVQPLGPTVRTRERRLWTARLRFALLSLLMPTLLVLAVRWYWGLRVVASGLVESSTVVLRAPAAVRIAEVHCRDGQIVHLGDPLFRLEARNSVEQRRVLEYAVEQKRLRVELAERGGTLFESDIGARGDRLEEARSELSAAEGEQRVAVAELDRLTKARESRVVALEQEKAQREGDLGVLAERVREATARSAGAQADESLAQVNLQSHADLKRDGIVSPLDLKEWEHGYDAARNQVQASTSDVQALKREVEKSERVDSIARRLETMTLDELDAQIGAQKERVSAAAERRQLWSRIVERRERLSPDEDASELRSLQLELCRAELREAEAQLAALDATIGNVIVHAECDGIVDQVFVAEGQLVDAGQQLASCFDPAAQWGVAYLLPEHASRVAPGLRCRILLEDLDVELAGRVAWVSRTWVPCPRLIRHADEYEMRLPVRIDCEQIKERSRLWPGARFRVLFADLPASRSPP